MPRDTVPPHKLVPHTDFAVDAFQYAAAAATKHTGASRPGRGIRAWFLSHAHSDHYTGLTERWDAGPIYCSSITADLLQHLLGVPESLLHRLPMDTPTDVMGVEVTLIDANHCPGAAILLFKLPSGARYVHTGDFRFSPRMIEDPHLQRFVGCDVLYLDTTYGASQKHAFGPQEESIEYIASTAAKVLEEGQKANVTVAVAIATYGVGKERILTAVHQATGVPICVDDRRLGVLRLLRLTDVDVDSAFTTDRAATSVHGVRWNVIGETWPFFRPNFQAMEELREDLGVDRLVGFVPSGWVHSARDRVRKKGPLEVHVAPYSEHSSFPELVELLKFIKPGEMVPTVVGGGGGVNGGPKARAREERKLLKLFSPYLHGSMAKAAFISSAFGGGAKQQQEPSGERPVQGNAAPDDETRGDAAEQNGDDAGPGTVPASGEHDANGEHDDDATNQPRSDDGDGSDSDGIVIVSKNNVQPGERKGKRREADGGAPTRDPDCGDSQLSPAKAAAVDEVLAVLGEELQREEVVGLLRASQWRPQDAINKHLDGSKAASPAKADITVPLADYDPEKAVAWGSEDEVPYLHVANTLEVLASTSGRNAGSDALTNMFRSVFALRRSEITDVVYATIGKLAPDYEGGADMGVGGSTVIQAICEATGTQRARISKLYRETGDLGDAAGKLSGGQALLRAPKPLTVAKVMGTLRKIAAAQGSGSQLQKRSAAVGLLRACRGCEMRFLVRTLSSNLRVGAGWRTVLAALGRAALLDEERRNGSAPTSVPKKRLDAAGQLVLDAYQTCPSVNEVVDALLAGPVEDLPARSGARLMAPVQPMLAIPVSPDVEDPAAWAVTKLGLPFLAEHKYDGQRIQVHLSRDGRARVFSRNCEDRTKAFPDVVKALAAASRRDTLIVDAEVVGIDWLPGVSREQWRPDGTGGAARPYRLRAFQELATRPRGSSTTTEPPPATPDIEVCAFCFDLLLEDGESLLPLPLSERRARLAAAIAPTTGVVEVAQGTVISADDAAGAESDSTAPAAAQIMQHMSEAWAAGAEGLVLKALPDKGHPVPAPELPLAPVPSRYEPGKRSQYWIKMKRDYLKELRDSLDVVVIGAWFGTGRKHKWLSPFLLAVRDPDSGDLQSLCRCMSGFSDAFYQEATARLLAKAVEVPPPYYRTGESPAVWFGGELEVWEITGADLSISPVHRAAEGRVAGAAGGVALRFPRFLRVRPDKTADEATDAARVADMYAAQTRRAQ
ncbi:unnamed protein product [Pedinophyceae sp. YPF-701]|nr:unnamed protein product [Pedinophyceae sp. YPF-701]